MFKYNQYYLSMGGLMKNEVSLFLLVLIMISSGCIGGDQPTKGVKTTTLAPITVPRTTTPAPTTTTPPTTTLFEQGKSSLTVLDTFESVTADGWVVEYSDYPQTSDPEFYEFSSGVKEIPLVDGTTAYGMYIEGNNHADDLFMFMKKQVTGLKSNTDYSVTFKFDLATNVLEGMMGIGGSPGESVFVKAGASTIEPSNIVDDQGWFRLNIDKANQANGGKDMLYLGHIASPDVKEYETFAIKTFDTSREDFTVTTDSNGNTWIIFGTDSGFEGKTTIYYSSVEVQFEEV
jgi:hypothetical protein